MTLVACPECAKEVSDRAPACPNCGYPVAREPARAAVDARPESDTTTQRRLQEREAHLARLEERRARREARQRQDRAAAFEESQRLARARVPRTLVAFQVFAVLYLTIGAIVALSSLAISGQNELAVPAGGIVAVGMFVSFFGIWLYFVPTLTAAERNASNRGAVTAVNILLGWTLIGWILALILAYSDDAPYRWRRVKGGWKLVPKQRRR